MRVATRLIVDDAVEVHKRIMLRRVFILRSCAAGPFNSPRRHVPARRALACRIISHVLHVSPPHQLRGLELVRHGLHHRRIQATYPQRLPVGIEVRLAEAEFRHGGTVSLSLCVRRLAADQRQVVIETEVADAIVLVEERALGSQGVGQVRRRGVFPERDPERLVFQHQDEDVPHRRRGADTVGDNNREQCRQNRQFPQFASPSSAAA